MAAGEPPFVLAMSVHSALARAASASGEGAWVDLAAPATCETLLTAVERVHGAMGCE